MYICLEEVNILSLLQDKILLFPSRQLKLQDYMFIILTKKEPKAPAQEAALS